MTEHDRTESGQLERRLDAAFRETRPRPGFEDELWARLQARRRWWLRAGDALGRAPRTGVAAGLVTVLVVGLLVTAVRLTGTHGGGARSSSSTQSQPTSQAAPAAPGASRADTAGGAGLPFGRLPAPAAAGVVQVNRPGGPSPLPSGLRGVTVQAVNLPQPAPGLAVYRYDPASGPADGTTLETNAVPAALPAGIYPSRPAADAVAAAGAAGNSSEVVLTQARLLYVAVVSGDQGYLEPAYLFTCSAGGVPVQVLLPALAAAALR